MKSLISLSLGIFLSLYVLGQNTELSDRLIKQYHAGQISANKSSFSGQDHLWLTPILREALVNWNDLTDEAKLVFKKYRSRPALNGTIITTDAGNFKFHYTTDGGDGEAVDATDSDGNNIPDYIDNMIKKFNTEVYALYHTTTGLTVPPNDGTEGGDAKYDIYISNNVAGEGTYGYVASESEIGDNPNSTDITELLAYSSYMVMRNNYEGFGDIEKAIKATVAHEYMHAVQMGYNVDMDGWFMEMGATWAEDFAYSVDDNFQYLMGLYGKPDVALNILDNESTAYKGHWYSIWVFAKYMTEQKGNAIMKNIYERCVTKAAIVSVEEELSANHNSSFNELFSQFAIANLLMTSDNAFAPYVYSKAADYKTYINNNGGLYYENNNAPFSYSGTDITWNSKTNGNDRLMRLSADYFKLTSNSNFKIKISPVPADTTAKLAIVKTSATTKEVVYADNNGEINVNDHASWTTISPIVIRYTKSVNDTNSFDYSISITQSDVYTISASANPTAGGTISGTGDFSSGQNVNLIATANTGYNFVNWTEGGTVVSTNAAYSFAATSSRTLVANFQEPTYAISATANPSEGGTVSGANDYTQGATASLVATPNTGYAFVNWTEGGVEVSTNATYSFTVNSARTLVANFQIQSYDIVASAMPTEGGSVSGTGNFTFGTTANLVATANTGYIFVNWTEGGQEVSTDAAYSFTVNSARTLVANFQVPSYDIAASAMPTEGGSVSGTGNFTFGTTANLVATASTGYDFVNWTEGGVEVSTDAAYSFTVNSARTLVANFQIQSYDIAASAMPSEGGSVSGTGNFTYGTTANLVATASTGYDFVNWTEGGVEVSTDAAYSFTVNSARTLEANFQIQSYDIAASAMPSEGGSVSGTGNFTYGTTANLVATASTGYDFVNWTEGGVEVSTDAAYSFTVNSARTLEANFQIQSYDIAASAAPIEGGSVSGTGNFIYGTTANLVATASIGYDFVNWTEGGTEISVDATYSFTVDAARTLVANFEVQEFEIVINVDPMDAGSVSGQGFYDYGAVASLEAMANDGFIFDVWMLGDEEYSNEASIDIEVVSDMEWVAKFIPTTGVSTKSSSSAMSIFPNPAMKNVSIQINALKDLSDADVYLIDIAGKRISLTFSIQSSNTLNVNLDGHNAGIYYLQLFDNGSIIGIEKVMIVE